MVNMNKKYHNFTITVNESILNNIDLLVSKKYFNSRSELVRHALLKYLPRQIENRSFFNIMRKIKDDLINGKINKKSLLGNKIVINGIEKLIVNQEKFNNDNNSKLNKKGKK